MEPLESSSADQLVSVAERCVCPLQTPEWFQREQLVVLAQSGVGLGRGCRSRLCRLQSRRQTEVINKQRSVCFSFSWRSVIEDAPSETRFVLPPTPLPKQGSKEFFIISSPRFTLSLALSRLTGGWKLPVPLFPALLRWFGLTLSDRVRSELDRLGAPRTVLIQTGALSKGWQCSKFFPSDLFSIMCRVA